MLNDTGEVRVRGPVLAPLSQLQGQQRWIILLLSTKRPMLHQLISSVREKIGRGTRGVRFIIDVDPHDFT